MRRHWTPAVIVPERECECASLEIQDCAVFDNGTAHSVLTRHGTESVLYLYVVLNVSFYFPRKLTFVSLEFALKTVIRCRQHRCATHSQGGCYCFSPVAVSFSLHRWTDVYKNPLKDVRHLYVSLKSSSDVARKEHLERRGHHIFTPRVTLQWKRPGSRW